MTTTRALVLLSGGQDSTVCLAWALSRYPHVETIGFDYGQRHRVELDVRPRLLSGIRDVLPQWADRLGEDHVLTAPTIGSIGQTAMTSDIAIRSTAAGLPNTFVPGRNLVFFTYAAALGSRRDLHTLVGGMCETDYSGYPDCRNDTLQCLAQAISLGIAEPFAIATPLMYLDKAATWALAEELGGKALVQLIVEATHTCYLGDRTNRHEWGYGCGLCPACRLRSNGWDKWQASIGAVSGSGSRS